MYNEFLFFYEKEPYKQFIWRYGSNYPMGRKSNKIA